ncbi:MAG: YkvA family protein [Microcystaceae cyanobacterium]
MKNLVESFYGWYSSKVRHPRYRWVIVIGTLLYLLSPIDISPDFIPIIGWIDDGVVITLLTTELSRLLIDKRKGNTIVQDDSDDVVEAKVIS